MTTTKTERKYVADVLGVKLDGRRHNTAQIETILTLARMVERTGRIDGCATAYNRI